MRQKISLYIKRYMFLGTLFSTKFQQSFRDENASKKGGVDNENDVKSGKKLQ